MKFHAKTIVEEDQLYATIKSVKQGDCRHTDSAESEVPDLPKDDRPVRWDSTSAYAD